MQRDRYRTQIADEAQAGRLADIRVEAMRPSLEAAGRFDPDRARQRFLDSFRAEDTSLICLGDSVAGFYVVRRKSDHLYLDHLYVIAAFQGLGIGRRVVDDLKIEAEMHALPIRLMALNGSPSNDFYQSLGFRVVSADDLDTIYEWLPDSHSAG
ncbi:GNAT family N-acetyltransferase [Mesorhizobium sp. CAU 1732]|uniref:GNAT family N-acetyltransferase n=1 Tax=Mesorhizobium sp. CAU 1732 TaxID=3140358 RepID=UPI003260643C